MGYNLLASESTVQVLSPTVVRDVTYCTIQTTKHGVIASMPVPAGGIEPLQNGNGQLILFSNAIDEVVDLDEVIGGAGSQTIDQNGLLADNVVFTVEYVPAGSSNTSITADAVVPVSVLVANQSGPGYEADISGAEAIIKQVYDGLAAAASG